jgi:hypothetical protein
MITPEAGPSVSRQCALLGVARSSFYYRPRPETAEELELLRRLSPPAYSRFVHHNATPNPSFFKACVPPSVSPAITGPTPAYSGGCQAAAIWIKPRIKDPVAASANRDPAASHRD